MRTRTHFKVHSVSLSNLDVWDPFSHPQNLRNPNPHEYYVAMSIKICEHELVIAVQSRFNDILLIQSSVWSFIPWLIPVVGMMSMRYIRHVILAFAPQAGPCVMVVYSQGLLTRIKHSRSEHYGKWSLWQILAQCHMQGRSQGIIFVYFLQLLPGWV